MASILLSHSSSPSISLSRTFNFLSNSQTICFRTVKPSNQRRSRHSLSVSASSACLEALIFDCDGVILESEHLHCQAYNDAFAHFNVRCSSQSLTWAPDFYDELQNSIGGGKPKMRWYFKEHGWPSSSIFETLRRMMRAAPS